ncbi:MAG: hypothetical protein AAFW89_00210 [Bacteroidota bacterium]
MIEKIDEITLRLFGLLDKQKYYYTPKELIQAGLSPFIVDRVRLEIQDKVSQGVKRPTSKWANNEDPTVLRGWRAFITSLVNSVRIPKDELYSTLYLVVNYIVHVIVMPRQYMAEYIFREDIELSLEELKHRTSRLTVYKHFGAAIPLYMERRGLTSLTRERCAALIETLDTKLIATYTPEDWVKKLEILFSLFEGEIESHILCNFFEDKELYHAAAFMLKLDTKVNKYNLKEIMSEIQAQDMEGTDEDKEEIERIRASLKLGQDENERMEEEEEVSSQEMALLDSFFGEYKPGNDHTDHEELVAPAPPKTKDEEEVAFTISGSEVSQERVFEELVSEISTNSSKDDLEEKVTLNALFTPADEEPGTDESKDANKKPPAPSSKKKSVPRFKDDDHRVNSDSISSLLQEAVQSLSDEDDLNQAIDAPLEEEDLIEETPQQESTPPSPASNEPDESNEQETGEEEEPMWAQFLSPEQMDIMMGTRGEDAEPESGDKQHVSLIDQLAPNKKKYVNTLFNGKSRPFNNAVHELSTLNTWDEAASYIRTEIFELYKVDMTSETVVEFTDALQNWFNEHK